MPENHRAPTCQVGRGQRLTGGVIAAVMIVFALAMHSTQPVGAIIAGIIAIAPLITAATGTCPATWLQTRIDQRREPGPADFTDARHLVDLPRIGAGGPVHPGGAAR